MAALAAHLASDGAQRPRREASTVVRGDAPKRQRCYGDEGRVQRSQSSLADARQEAQQAEGRGVHLRECRQQHQIG